MSCKALAMVIDPKWGSPGSLQMHSLNVGCASFVQMVGSLPYMS